MVIASCHEAGAIFFREVKQVAFDQKYTQEQKDRALELVRDGKTHREAAEETGIELNYLRSIIYRNREKLKRGHARRASQKQPAPSEGDTNEGNGKTKEDAAKSVIDGAAYTLAGDEIKRIIQENQDEVEEIVREAVQDRTMEIQEKLSEMVLLATQTAIDTIKKGPGSKESKSYWLKSVIGAIAQGVEKYQLIGGKPTGRLEQQGQVTQRYEYDILHKVEEYAGVYEKLANRGAFAGLDESHDLGESLDTNRTDT